MATPITVPRLGWNMEQGVFVGWLKADGAAVRAGEALFTLESDKATDDIEGFDDGILHIPAGAPCKGDVVAVGALLGFLLQPGEPIPAPLSPRDAPQRTEVVGAKQTTAASVVSAPPRDRPASSPRARVAAARLGVDLQNVSGGGLTGRIRERDVLAHAPASLPISRLREVIAKHMLTSHRSTAPVTLTTTIDATNLVQLRKHLKAAASGHAPSFTDLLVKLAALALKEHPALNSRWENDRIVSPNGIHIGLAVDTEAGLLVPIVRDVPALSLVELSARTRDLSERARRHKVTSDEMQGGTFTVTSLGAFGIDAFTPIINYPECAILGVGCIRQTPAVVDKQIVIRDQMTLSLTFDHRIADGAPAARFLQTLARLIERPPPLA